MCKESHLGYKRVTQAIQSRTPEAEAGGALELRGTAWSYTVPRQQDYIETLSLTKQISKQTNKQTRKMVTPNFLLKYVTTL